MEKRIVVAVSVFVQNDKGEYLFLKRSPVNSTGVNQYQLPEGKMEWGETPEETLNREMQEELGSYVHDAVLIGAKSVRIVAKGFENHVVRIIYKGKFDGKITLSEDHTAFIWIGHINALRLDLIPGIQEMIEEFTQKGLL